MGGIPWSIDNLPFGDRPTMVIGISCFSKRGQKNILGLCASINHKFNRFFSRVSEQNGEIGEDIQ